MTNFCRVAVDSAVQALDRGFDYEIPDRMLGRVDVGSVVRVILHGRNMRGFVTDLLDEPAVAKPRPLRSLVSPQPLFGRSEIQLAAWIARRYIVPLGLVLHDAVPGRFSTTTDGVRKATQGKERNRPEWLTTQGEGVDVDSLLGSSRAVCMFPPTLRDEPELVSWLASEVSARNGQVLIVCPRVEVGDEIAALIPGSVTLHGSERPSDRASGWSALSSGGADVAVVGRAGLLVPMPRLAMVVVASAHDHSLKSERAPRIHALLVAKERARRAGAAFVASSPAPPLEVAHGPDLGWIASKRRANRPETARPRKGPVTPRLIEVVSWAIKQGQDALVFTGRRGDALRLRCTDCGWNPACPACGRGMLPPAEGTTRLRCRVCGTESAVPEVCPSCGGALSGRGWGHERVARELERAGIAVPVVRVVRGDVPVGARPHPAVVIGTLAAANTTRNAGCVCVADLDQLLARPDFRASEYAFQVLHQLARSLAPGGRFLIQTREPEHHAVQGFVRNSYRYFFDREIGFREETRYPPFGSVVRVEIDPGAVEDLRAVAAAAGGELIGALPRGKSKLNALIRIRELEGLLAPLRTFAGQHSGTKIDVDPVDIL